MIVVKSYTVTHFEDGSQSMKRVNDGFNPLELLGVSDFIGQEIKEQIQGKIKPDTITRQVVVD